MSRNSSCLVRRRDSHTPPSLRTPSLATRLLLMHGPPPPAPNNRTHVGAGPAGLDVVPLPPPASPTSAMASPPAAPATWVLEGRPPPPLPLPLPPPPPQQRQQPAQPVPGPDVTTTAGTQPPSPPGGADRTAAQAPNQTIPQAPKGGGSGGGGLLGSLVLAVALPLALLLTVVAIALLVRRRRKASYYDLGIPPISGGGGGALRPGRSGIRPPAAAAWPAAAVGVAQPSPVLVTFGPLYMRTAFDVSEGVEELLAAGAITAGSTRGGRRAHSLRDSAREGQGPGASGPPMQDKQQLI